MALVLNGSNDTITGLQINSANIVDGSIVNADINASAAIASTKISGSLGKFASYAIIADEKAYNTTGGNFTTGDWRTRDLNTELADADGIVSISSNQFTLQAGTYLIKAAAPTYYVQRHVIKLYNVTDSSDALTGQTAFNTAGAAQTNAFLFGRVTIGAAKVFEIRHRCQATYNTYGFGVQHDFSGNSSIYTVVEIYKES